MEHLLKCHKIIKTNFVRGENCFLFDSEGRRYLDLESGIWCTILGHNHPRINLVMKDQIDQIIHLGTYYPPQIAEDTAKSLLNLLGWKDGKCIFLSSGSEAVEFGVQVIRRLTKKRLITFSTSYLAAYGSAGKKMHDDWYLIDWQNPQQTAKEISNELFGGFAFEPGGSGSGFVTFPPIDLIQELAEKIKNQDGLILANEVTTGIGRTGKWFGFEHYEIEPDIIAIGKSLGNGYPVSAVVMRSSIANWLENTDFLYAQSHQNDPLGCQVAKEVLSTLQDNHWIERGANIGHSFLCSLQKIASNHRAIKDVRGRGMLLGIEFDHNLISAKSVFDSLFEAGFLIGFYPSGNLIRFDPALTIPEDQITHLIEFLDELLKSTD